MVAAAGVAMLMVVVMLAAAGVAVPVVMMLAAAGITVFVVMLMLTAAGVAMLMVVVMVAAAGITVFVYLFSGEMAHLRFFIGRNGLAVHKDTSFPIAIFKNPDTVQGAKSSITSLSSLTGVSLPASSASF